MIIHWIFLVYHIIYIIQYSIKKCDKFFIKHPNVLEQFKHNLKQYYDHNEENIDIIKLRGYKDFFRMRVGKYRIIYRVDDGNIIIITTLLVESRGEAYNHFNKKRG